MSHVDTQKEVEDFVRFASEHGARRPMILHLFEREMELGLVSKKFIVDTCVAEGMSNQRGQLKDSPLPFFYKFDQQFEITLFLSIYRAQKHQKIRDKLQSAWLLFIVALEPITHTLPKMSFTDAWQTARWLNSGQFSWHSCRACSASYPIPREMPNIASKCPVCKQISKNTAKTACISKPVCIA